MFEAICSLFLPLSDVNFQIAESNLKYCLSLFDYIYVMLLSRLRKLYAPQRRYRYFP